MGPRSRSIQGNGDVTVCVQGSDPRRGDIRERGRSCRADPTPIRQAPRISRGHNRPEPPEGLPRAEVGPFVPRSGYGGVRQ
jgi:hypothetical protein